MSDTFRIFRLLTSAILLTLCLNVQAKGEDFLRNDSAAVPVDLYWSVDFESVFDNREGDRSYTADRTFFLTQLAPEIGIDLNHSRHRIAGGAVWTQPIGCEWDGRIVSPTLYYMYEPGSGVRFAMGMFPRTLLVHELPDYIESDSTRYFQHNLRSTMFGYKGRDGYFQGILDWRGMQSETRREAFSLIAQGEWAPDHRVFMAGGVAMLNHLAKQKNAPETQHIVDNIMVNPYVGVQFRPGLKYFDRVELRAGALMSLTRDRGDENWLKGCGFWSNIEAYIWRLKISNTLYAGGSPLFPLYNRYGSILYDGEPFYASRRYDRLSFRGVLMEWRDIIRLEAALDFNFTDRGMIFYQRLMLRINL